MSNFNKLPKEGEYRCEIHNDYEEVDRQRLRFTVITVIGIILTILFASVASAEAAVLQSNEGTTVDTENFGVGHNKGQSFEHNTDFDIESIDIWGGLGNTPASSVTLTVFESDYTTSVCSDTIDVSGWPNWSSADWQTMTISCSGLLANTIYILDIGPDDGSSSDAIRWATSDTGYADGDEYYDSSIRITRDTMFRVNGTENGGGGGGTTTSSTTDATSTILAINSISITLLTFLSFLMFLIGAIIPLWLWKSFKQ